jgi:SAM-dependent methyltransferase
MAPLLRKLVPRRIKDDLKRYIAGIAEIKVREYSDRAALQFSALEERLSRLNGRLAEIDAHRTQLAEIEAKIIVLNDRVADLATRAAQVDYVLGENNLPPPPPKHLQVRVVGGYVPHFMESGFNALRDIDAALAPSGRTLTGFRRILDFGCGCGRVIRTLKSIVPGAALSGTDIDPEAIVWLQKNYGRFGDFAVAPHLPPTAYAANTFDFIYGISVFTHLPEDMQFRWLEELRRITQPGGYLVLSVHGEKHWKALPDEARARVETQGFHYGDLGWNYGASINLPDFYQTAYHAHDYVRREWGRYFSVIDIQTLRMDQHQDTVLLQKRA